MRDLVIVGAGDLGRVLLQIIDDINSIAARWRFQGFVDDAAEELVSRGTGLPVVGPLDWLLTRQDTDVVIGVGDPTARRDVLGRLIASGLLDFPPVRHPACHAPASVGLGRGTVLYPGACIDPYVTLGEFVIVGKNTSVGHDTVVEDFVTLSPGCSIGGRVTIGAGAFLGIGACSVPGVRIGKRSVIGAGAAVIDDVGEGTTVVGVPARPIRTS